MFARQPTNRHPQASRQQPMMMMSDHNGARSGGPNSLQPSSTHAPKNYGGGMNDLSHAATATRIDAVIASASATVAEVCDAQVGQVKTALSHACESEVRQLRAVLAEACSGETEKLRNAMSVACERELHRVSSSLATACAREVEVVSSQCQSEVERVKGALREACEAEVASVRETCKAEVQLVKEALKTACEAEVSLVRDACREEVQRVKIDLAEACQQEVAALLSSMEHDFGVARARQRRELEEAAEPYIRAVHHAQLQTSRQLEALNAKQASEEARVRTLESQTLRASQRLTHITTESSARERAGARDAAMRAGAPFLVMRVERADNHLARLLLGSAPKLEVHTRHVRLARDGEGLSMRDLHPARRIADGAPADATLLISSIVGVALGGPTWCADAARMSLPELHAASSVQRGERPEASDAGERRRPCQPPSWHMLTLQVHGGPPFFLCAPSAEQALSWAAGLAALLPPPGLARAGNPRALPPPSYAALLWRRVRLRLDALAMGARVADDDGGDGDEYGGRLEGGVGSRLGALSTVLRGIAAEEEARRDWVRNQLGHGDHAGAARMGWTGGPVSCA